LEHGCGSVTIDAIGFRSRIMSAGLVAVTLLLVLSADPPVERVDEMSGAKPLFAFPIPEELKPDLKDGLFGEARVEYDYWLGFSPDGKNLAARVMPGTRKERVFVWDVATGKKLHEKATESDTGFRADQHVAIAAFTPDGGRILTGLGKDDVVDLAPSPDAKQTARLTPTVSTVKHDRWRWLCPGKAGVPWTIAIVPEPQMMMTVRQWDWGKIEEPKSFLINFRDVNCFETIAVNSSGSQLAVGYVTNASVRGTRYQFELIDLKKDLPRRAVTGHVANISAVAYSPDGTLLASGAGDGTVKLWDVVTGKELAQFETTTFAIWCLTFSPDGKRLAYTSTRGTKPNVVIVDVEKRSLGWVHHADPHTFQVAFNDKGDRLATVGRDRLVRVWDVAKLAAYERK
jgi:WD40 repeat protein